MTFLWSENAKIGLRFLAEWNEECRIPEKVIDEAESRLKIKFPTILRSFYSDWGGHQELVSTTHQLFKPSECSTKGSYLIFAVENQYVFFWGIRIEDLQTNNPPVYYAYNEGNELDWSLIHNSTTQFLDWLLFGHVFGREALKGGFGLMDGSKALVKFLESNDFSEIQLDSAPWGLRMESDERPWQIFYNETTLITFDESVSYVSEDQSVAKILNGLANIEWQYLW